MTIGFSTRSISAPIGAALRNRFGKEPVKYVPLSQFFTSKKPKDDEDDDALYGRRARTRTRKGAKKEPEKPEERKVTDTDAETQRTKKNPKGAKEKQEQSEKGQLGAHSEMTLSTNVATTPVPVGAGDGRKFLDYGPGHPYYGRDFSSSKKRKKKRKSLSKRLSYLLTIP